MTLLTATRMGLGLALLPEYVANEALAAKEIVHVLPDYSPQENWFKAYVPRRRMASARVKALVDWLGKEWA
jgi:DNA-binding transcriptional LysR family regulator